MAAFLAYGEVTGLNLYGCFWGAIEVAEIEQLF